MAKKAQTNFYNSLANRVVARFSLLDVVLCHLSLHLHVQYTNLNPPLHTSRDVCYIGMSKSMLIRAQGRMPLLVVLATWWGHHATSGALETPNLSPHHLSVFLLQFSPRPKELLVRIGNNWICANSRHL